MDIIYQEIIETKQLIKEAFDRNTIVDAIKNRRILYIKYKGEDTVNVGYRTIEPCVLGVTTAGNMAIRAWQQNGSSDSFKSVQRPMRPNHDSVPEWRLFRLDGILDVIDTGKQFTLTPQKLAKYNSNDMQLSTIYMSILPAEGSKPISKSDIESVFANQEDKFKGFYNAPVSSDMKIKDSVLSIYDLVKKMRKKSPEKYFVVNKKGTDQYFAVPDKSTLKYGEDEIIGNLKTLYDKYNPKTTISEPEASKVVEPDVNKPVVQVEPITTPELNPEQPKKTQADIDREEFLK